MKVKSKSRTRATVRLTGLAGAAVVLGGGSVPDDPGYLGQAIVELVPGANIGPIAVIANFVTAAS